MKNTLILIALTIGCCTTIALAQSYRIEFSSDTYSTKTKFDITKSSDTWFEVLSFNKKTGNVLGWEKPIYIIFSWKEFCKEYGHNWKEVNCLECEDGQKRYKCAYCAMNKESIENLNK